MNLNRGKILLFRPSTYKGLNYRKIKIDLCREYV